MKTILSIVSVLMLVIGAITLGTGALDVGLLLGSDGGAVAEALAGLAVVVFVVGGLLDIIGGLLGLIAGVISVVLSFNVTNLCACIIPLVYFLCAIAVRSGNR